MLDEKNGAEVPVDDVSRDACTIEERILQNAEADPYISQEELAQVLGLSRRTIQRKIADLKQMKRLARIGSGRTKCWKVNYENR